VGGKYARLNSSFQEHVRPLGILAGNYLLYSEWKLFVQFLFYMFFEKPYTTTYGISEGQPLETVDSNTHAYRGSTRCVGLLCSVYERRRTPIRLVVTVNEEDSGDQLAVIQLPPRSFESNYLHKRVESFSVAIFEKDGVFAIRMMFHFPGFQHRLEFFWFPGEHRIADLPWRAEIMRCRHSQIVTGNHFREPELSTRSRLTETIQED